MLNRVAPQTDRGRSLHTRAKYILVSCLFGASWIASVACGFALFARYDNQPGRTGALPARWPSVGFALERERPTLVMVAHPRCPCTRASIGELARIMARAKGKLSAVVLFVRPESVDCSWNETDLWRSARQIPGVTTVVDAGGVAAKKLGAETSGHVLLFAPDGRLLFNGGITESRGHAGGNLGENTILSLVTGETVQRNQTPVFGCALANPERAGQRPKCAR